MKNTRLIVTLLLTFGLCSLYSQQRGMKTLIKETGKEPQVYDHSWALIIGINKYQEWPQLDYAVNDAKSVREMLITKFGFSNDHVIMLINEKASLENIKNSLSDIAAKANQNDRVLVYYSGHGQTLDLKGGGQMGFLVPVEGSTRDDRLYSTCLPMQDVKTLSTLIPAKHILFLVDACYSGLAAVTQKGRPRESNLYLKQVASERGRQIITAGRKGEQSSENSEWGHGAFTYELLQGLENGLADMDNDGIITSQELGEFLKSKVTRLSNYKQTPQFKFLSDEEGEFVFIRDDVEIPEDMVYVRGGSLNLNNESSNEDQAVEDQNYVDGFFMDKYEVTVAKYKEFCSDTKRELPKQPDWSSDRHPVVNVSWEDAVVYSEWIQKRLPTNKEWEYAAMGNHGIQISDQTGWNSANTNLQAHIVGTKKPNRFGLYDMLGNVWEWCSDMAGVSRESDRSRFVKHTRFNTGMKILRGGSWKSNLKNVTSPPFEDLGEKVKLEDVGFRCVRSK